MSSKNGKQVFSVFEIYPKNKKCEGICSVEFDCCVFFVYHYICGCKETRIIPVLPQHSLAKKILQPDSLIMQRKKAWEIEAGMLACKGDYAGAYEKSCLIAALSDSLASRDIHLSSIAIDKAFRNWEKQQEIIRQKQELKYWNVLTYLLLFPLCAFIFMIVKQWYNYRTIQQVNLNLIEHVNMQREERDRLFRSLGRVTQITGTGRACCSRQRMSYSSLR